jgi:rhamnose transport system permease protein
MNFFNFLRHRDAALALIIIVLIGLIGLRAPVFLTPESLTGVLTDTSFLFMLVLAQMAVILTRGIDLSVAANLALSGMVAALVSRAMPGVPLIGIVLLATALGASLGALNGLFIAGIGIPPIVVTLGTLSIYRGAIFLIAGGSWLTSKDMSAAFLAFPKTSLLGIPILIVITALTSLAFWAFLNHSRAGRGLYAVGGNPLAARYCGISLPAQQFLVYTLAGAVSGLCGYLWVSRYGIAYTDIAQGYELTIIAACVIGGVSIAGGVGSVQGALLGALFLGVVVNALPVINVSPFWQMLISGAVILAAVVLNARSERRSGKLILRESRRGSRQGETA